MKNTMWNRFRLSVRFVLTGNLSLSEWGGPVIVEGNSILKCSGNSMSGALAKPQHVGDGNVVFPAAWPDEQRRNWRVVHGVQGYETNSKRIVEGE